MNMQVDVRGKSKFQGFKDLSATRKTTLVVSLAKRYVCLICSEA